MRHTRARVRPAWSARFITERVPPPRVDLEIAPLTEKEIPRLARILKAVADEEVHVTLPPGLLKTNVEAMLDASLSRAEAGDTVERVAKLKGRVIGGGSLERGAYRQEHVADVFVFIAKDYRGRGIGGRILDALTDEARALGIRKLATTILAGNAAARDLLASRAFEEEGLRRRQHDLGYYEEDEVLYAKFLT